MLKELIKSTTDKMEMIILNLLENLKKIRTGRVSASLFEDIRVSYYGTQTPLKELASIMIPEANQVQIKPFDRNAINDIELAIQNSDLGLNPINDGNFVRISLPPLTEERRRELAVHIKKEGEVAKVSVRNARSEAWNKVKSAEKKGELTEDDRYQAEKELNDLTEKMNKEIDREITKKEEDILKI